MVLRNSTKIIDFINDKDIAVKAGKQTLGL